ncbi:MULTISPECIES: enoyl-CoA hydratase-related protein [unclassified Variovorax]|uniref:enoyl-CoA hydratase-related protein n=1 Tax=unclassified Variovorax TaxID=663243 RepID=UPI001BD463D1|nr:MULTISPECIES: enoyl-CoA hydratase-related protein [unclassified Variovorax]
MPEFKYLTVEPQGDGVYHVQLARPPANAVHRDMYIELKQLFGNVDQLGDDVRAIVLSGQGKHFCGGNDLEEFATMTPDNAVERMWRVREAFFAISECAVPVIAAVHGAAMGTGLAIAGSCDFVVAAKDARLGLPELTVGVMGGARHLARMAPQPVVRRMYFTGDPMSAQDLASAGAAIVVCEGDKLMDEAMRFARRIAQHSPTAVRVSKRVLDRIESMDLRTGYEFEQGATSRMSGHPDSKEALAAFKEKRPARFMPRSGEGHWFGM